MSFFCDIRNKSRSEVSEKPKVELDNTYLDFGLDIILDILKTESNNVLLYIIRYKNNIIHCIFFRKRCGINDSGNEARALLDNMFNT